MEVQGEFPSNSNNRKIGPAPSEKKVQRVTRGEATRKKKSLSKRMAEAMGGGDVRSVWGFVAFDVLIPAAKDMVVEAVTQGFERMIFPDSSPRSRGRFSHGGRSHINYGNRFGPGRDDRDRGHMSPRGRATHDFGEIILDTRGDAEEVIDGMFELLSKYDVVSVADLYNLAGISANYTDEKWGWTDLRGAGATRLRSGSGYLLDLPRPEPIRD